MPAPPSRGTRPRTAAAGSGLPPAAGKAPGTEPRRGSGGRPLLAFPVPVLLHGSKPARAARGGDPPSSPGLEETATWRCSESRAAAVRAAGISVASPLEAGGGEGRQGRGPGLLPAAPGAASPAEASPAVPACHLGGLVNRRRPGLRRGITKQLHALEALLLHKGLRSGCDELRQHNLLSPAGAF